ncbi:unnamed protein product [Caenorhabditis angaria]|uniref:DH domain-containing protein n=1 Tax=Caenorhabditis angaria TaxID=860376 RepID=A0A9P1IEY3_9PELO|nr:unnamed protein product [Caenorhabditis angaria]
MKEEMKKVYPPYLNSYDTAKTLFDQLDRENAKFHTFCKAKESNPDFRRLKLNDLMVKPVQRLPSVILLLKEMLKKSESSRLKSSAEEAAKSVDEVLKIANKTRERNDHLIQHMSKFTDIENVPPHLVASNRMFIRDMTVNPIASTAPRLQQFNQMKLFLFHDVLLITKIRSQKNTMQRFARHASFVSLHSRTRRPYKYIEQIPLSSMRSGLKIRAPDNFWRGIENMPFAPPGSTTTTSGTAPKNEPILWCMIHRDLEGGDTETLFEADTEEEVVEFFDDIHIKTLSNFGRYFYSGECQPSTVLSEHVAELAMRYFRRQLMATHQHGSATNVSFSERTPRHHHHDHYHHHHNDNPFAAPNPQQSQSKMRRAFSNAQITLATTFGFSRPFQSRTNLSQINENSSMMASPRVSCDPAALANMTSVGGMRNAESESTPKRGIRARLTSATFLNRTLNRNQTLRRQTVFSSHSEMEPALGPTCSNSAAASATMAKPPTLLPPKPQQKQRVTDI